MASYSSQISVCAPLPNKSEKFPRSEIEMLWPTVGSTYNSDSDSDSGRTFSLSKSSPTSPSYEYESDHVEMSVKKSKSGRKRKVEFDSAVGAFGPRSAKRRKC